MAEGNQGLRELSDRSRTLKLPDGRALGYCCYGEEGGAATFYFHGFPGSRLEAGFVAAPGLRLIAVDRPGYGLSSPLHGRALLDWPADVGALAGHLGLQRFGVLGISAGAPYALACAWALKDRITGAAIVCGIGPPDAPGMNEGLMRRLKRVGRKRMTFAVVVWLGRLILRRRDAERRFLAFRRNMNARLSSDVPKELAVSSDELARHLFVSWREGLRVSDGVLSDARIYASPWRFELHDIRVPVHFWHGTEDRIVPVAVARYGASKVPGAHAHIKDGEGHFSIILNWLPDIARSLIEESVP